MYKAFFGLTDNPFRKDIPVDDLFLSQDHREFVSRMEYFKTVRGFAVVYGEPGTGKTTSIRAFTSKLNPQLHRVIYLPLSALTVMDFYRNLSIALGLPQGYKKSQMFHEIQNYITNIRNQKNLTPLIVLDEAQFLGNGILNDLRMLFNLQFDSKDYVMVLLCAQPHFLGQLNLHVNEPLRQRILVHYEFKGLGQDEVPSYLEALLRSAGLREPIFSQDAIAALARASHGSPRLLNSMAEKCLILGFQKKQRNLDSEIVELANQEMALFQA
jgi:type II secretory pathway predicted ATPase ExeA